ncbi:UvrABC system protein C [Acrasis kona]|uniref:UvrABC system protein C n=1 Tax=Acrasis kona TaxID=1008807 RepID=A0AAW2ZLZ6_9EUKA
MFKPIRSRIFNNVSARNFNWFKFPSSSTSNPLFYKHLDLYTDGFNKICPYKEFSHPGIYKITNRKNGMMYIGMSLDIRKRIKQHIRDAFLYRYDKSSRQHDDSSVVSQAVAENDFDFDYEILEKIPLIKARTLTTAQLKKLLREKEREWIMNYKSYERNVGYNQVK